MPMCIWISLTRISGLRGWGWREREMKLGVDVLQGYEESWKDMREKSGHISLYTCLKFFKSKLASREAGRAAFSVSDGC